MIVKASRMLICRIHFPWRQLFQGRLLIVTNTLGGGCLMALGDCLQQSREMHMEAGRARNWRRTGSMFLVGCSMGFIEHYWYSWLDRMYVGRNMKAVAKKVLVDQTIFASGIGLWYFIGMALTEGRTLSDGCIEFKEKFWQYTRVNLCVWPLAQVINFYYLSPKYCVMYINVLSLGWNTYLSYLKHNVSHCLHFHCNF